MGLYIPLPIRAVLVFLAGTALAFWLVKLRGKIAGEPGSESDTFFRASVSAAVFAVLYYGGELIIGAGTYDVNEVVLRYLAAVVGAGCYWIGSRRH